MTETRTLNTAARRLLDGANIAHLSTLQPDGAPKAEPVWVLRDGDFILITTDGKSLKARNIAADPRVALSIVDYHNPYEQLLVRGHVVETRGDPELVVLDADGEESTWESTSHDADGHNGLSSSSKRTLSAPTTHP